MAEEPLRILYKGARAEIVEKKSRFIATMRPVQGEEEALAFLAEMKKEYWDARHNCYAYTIGEHHQLQRCSDDGEPQGTAGRPMLEVLLGTGVHNVMVVVTRYFGGVLLGTGGLVRAYQAATQAGLAESVLAELVPAVEAEITLDYTEYGKLTYLLGQMELSPGETVFEAAVTCRLLVPASRWEAFEKELVERTNGRALLTIRSREAEILQVLSNPR